MIPTHWTDPVHEPVHHEEDDSLRAQIAGILDTTLWTGLLGIALCVIGWSVTQL